MANERASSYEVSGAEYVDDGSGQSDGEMADMSSEKGLILEQDRLLPLANIGRIMKNVLPEVGKLSKEAKECMQECVSEFLLFISSEASDICANDSRKTLSGDDIVAALTKLGFDSYVDPASAYLRKYREAINGKSTADEGNGGGKNATPSADVVYTTMKTTVPEPYDYETKFQQNAHPHYQHHVLAAGGGMHPASIHSHQQYVPQPYGVPAGSYAGGAVANNIQPLVAGAGDTAVAGPSTTPSTDGASAHNVPELQEVNLQPVQMFSDVRTGQHYLRTADGNFVPIAFLTNQGVPPQLATAGLPSSATQADETVPPAKVARSAGASGRSSRATGGGRFRAGSATTAVGAHYNGDDDDANAGAEQSVGSYLRRQQQKLNPQKRVGK